MWRIAHCVYRAFRNTASHRCSQDVLVPITTVFNKDDDDDDSKQKKNDSCAVAGKYDIAYILKTNQFSCQNIDKLQNELQKIALRKPNQRKSDVPPSQPIQPASPVEEVQPVPPSNKTEDTLHSLLQADEACMKTLKQLSDLHAETMSTIHLQEAMDAFDAGNPTLGVEALQQSVKSGTNAAALYNLGLCYEQGLGVEHDRAKACDYYRQSSTLGHTHAQLSLTRLSNHLDLLDNEDETSEQTTIDHQRSSSPVHRRFLYFSPSKDDYQVDPSWSDHQFNFSTPTVACLS